MLLCRWKLLKLVNNANVSSSGDQYAIFTMINGSYNDYYKEYVNRNGFIENPIGFEKRKLEFLKDSGVTEGKGNEIMVSK